MDKLVLPGGHFEETDQSLSAACAREALEEIGFEVDPDELKLLTVLDDPKRDPRPGRRISVVFTIDVSSRNCLENCGPASDARAIEIREINGLTEEEIGFDHWEVVKILKNETIL